MSHLSTTWAPLRRVLLAALGAALVGTLYVATNSSAASHSAFLSVMGPPSTYTLQDTVSRSGAPGETLSFNVSAVNAGTQAQFRIVVGSSGLPTKVYKGSLDITSLAKSADGYYTPPLASGASDVLTVKVTLPSTAASQSTWPTPVNVYATDGVSIDSATLLSELSVAGSDGKIIGDDEITGYPNSFNHYATANSQKVVGGRYSDQTMTAVSISKTGTATFAVTLKNESPYPSEPVFNVSDGCSGAGWTVKIAQGFTDVTSKYYNTYGPRVRLEPGASAKFTITVKANYPSSSCPHIYVVTRTGWLGSAGQFNTVRTIRLLTNLAK